jgi:hypothetical protein
MSSWNLEKIVDGILQASVATYVFSFLGVIALFAFGIGISVWLTPKKDCPSEALKWPVTPPQKEVAGKKEPIQPPVPTRGNGT